MLVWRQGSLSRFSGACNSSEYDDHANGPILSRVRRRWDYLCAYLSSRVYMYIVLLYAGMHDDHGSRCGNVRCVYIHVVCPVMSCVRAYIFVGLSTGCEASKAQHKLLVLPANKPRLRTGVWALGLGLPPIPTTARKLQAPSVLRTWPRGAVSAVSIISVRSVVTQTNRLGLLRPDVLQRPNKQRV